MITVLINVLNHTKKHIKKIIYRLYYLCTTSNVSVSVCNNKVIIIIIISQFPILNLPAQKGCSCGGYEHSVSTYRVCFVAERQALWFPLPVSQRPTLWRGVGHGQHPGPYVCLSYGQAHTHAQHPQRCSRHAAHLHSSPGTHSKPNETVGDG